MDPTEIAFHPQALDASWASPVSVRWLGTAAFEVSYQGHVLLFDPYVTRASVARCALGGLSPDTVRIARYLPRADAIILGHTHFDHALDAPLVAKATGARVFGSRSAAVLCRSRGVPEDKIDVVERPAGSAPVDREVGPFRLRFHASAHSRFLAGRVPFPGEITDCDDVPMRVEKYKCGAVFGVEVGVAGKTLFHLGSAELVEGSLGKVQADLVMMTAAGWRSSRAFPERAMRALSPRAVVLAHWDNFFAPIEAGAKLLPSMHLDRLVDGLSAVARDVRVGTLPFFGEIRV